MTEWATCNSEKVHRAPVKILERKGPLTGVIQRSDLHEGVSLMLRNFRTDLRKKPWSKNDASAELRGQWLEVFTSLKVKDKTTFYSLSEVWSEVWSLAAPSSTKPLDWQFVVDARASLHKLRQERSELIGTGRSSSFQKPCNGFHSPTEKCKRTKKQQCTSTILDLFVTVQIIEGTLCSPHH